MGFLDILGRIGQAAETGLGAIGQSRQNLEDFEKYGANYEDVRSDQLDRMGDASRMRTLEERLKNMGVTDKQFHMDRDQEEYRRSEEAYAKFYDGMGVEVDDNQTFSAKANAGAIASKRLELENKAATSESNVRSNEIGEAFDASNAATRSRYNEALADRLAKNMELFDDPETGARAQQEQAFETGEIRQESAQFGLDAAKENREKEHAAAKAAGAAGMKSLALFNERVAGMKKDFEEQFGDQKLMARQKLTMARQVLTAATDGMVGHIVDRQTGQPIGPGQLDDIIAAYADAGGQGDVMAILANAGYDVAMPDGPATQLDPASMELAQQLEQNHYSFMNQMAYSEVVEISDTFKRQFPGVIEGLNNGTTGVPGNPVDDESQEALREFFFLLQNTLPNPDAWPPDIRSALGAIERDYQNKLNGQP
jgi:hypothetical protein